MTKFQRFVSQYQLAIFYILACLISWSTVLPLKGSVLPQGPLIAAFIIVGILAGRRGTSALWRKMKHWQVDMGWYLITPGLVVGFHLAALLISLLLGATITSLDHLRPPSYIFGVLLPLLLFGGLWEETGWTGYLLPRLLNQIPRSPLIASFASGVLRMIWHLPLVLSGAIPWYDFVFYSLAMQLMIAWLYNSTDGSILISMLFHLASNLLPSIMLPMFSGAERDLYWTLFVVCASLLALGIVLVTRGRLGKTPMEEPAVTIAMRVTFR